MRGNKTIKRAVTQMENRTVKLGSGPDSRRWTLPRAEWPSGTEGFSVHVLAQAGFTRAQGWEFKVLNRKEIRITAPSREQLQDFITSRVINPGEQDAAVREKRAVALMRLAIPLPR